MLSYKQVVLSTYVHSAVISCDLEGLNKVNSHNMVAIKKVCTSMHIYTPLSLEATLTMRHEPHAIPHSNLLAHLHEGSKMPFGHAHIQILKSVCVYLYT